MILAPFAALAAAVLAQPHVRYKEVASEVGTIACSPKTLKMGEKLKVTLTTPHGTDLQICGPLGPKRKCHFMMTSGSEPKDVFMGFDAFMRAGTFTIDTGSFKWYRGNIYEPRELVFSAPGVYEVRLSDNLETEDPNVESCRVTLKRR